jgi:hypothetical protein
MVIFEVVSQKRALVGVKQRDDLPCVEVVFGPGDLALEQQLDPRCQIWQTARCPQDCSIPATSYLLISPVDPFGVIAAADGQVESPR